jgi:beta-phosphoglucomutase-like phosphatase (HAD superfamily)
MDGLMFDTERLSLDGWIDAGKRLGFPITAELPSKTIGYHVRDTEKIFTAALPGFPFREGKKLCMEYVSAYVKEHGMPVKAGLFEILDFASAAHYRLAVATSTDRAKAEENLSIAGVRQYFDTVITGDQFTNGKPAPDIYVKACQTIESAPENCLAIEDSFAGIESAYRAGLKPIMVPDLAPPDETVRRMAWAVRPDLFGVIEILKQ